MKTSVNARQVNCLRFLIGFVAFRLFTSPKTFISNLREWARQRQLRRSQILLKAVWERLPHRDLVEQGRYVEFESAVQRMPLCRRAPHAFAVSGVRRERYFLHLEPQHGVSELHVADGLLTSSRSSNTPWRVLLLATNSLPYTKSGYTFRTHETAKALANCGVNVRVVTRYGYPATVGVIPNAETTIFDGVEYTNIIPSRFHFSPQKQTKYMTERVAKIAEDMCADLIVATTDFHNAIVAHRAAKCANIPWVYEVRGRLEDTWLSKVPKQHQDQAKNSERYVQSQKQEALYASAADAVVSLGVPITDRLLKEGVSRQSIYEIPNAVSPDAFGQHSSRARAKQNLGLPEGKLIGTVTSVVPYEGLDILLELASLDPSLNVLIVGDGVDLPRLKKMADELSIAERVIFAGRQPAETIWEWYTALDLFVLPRLDIDVCRDITPLKPLGAMAVGTPVLASDLPAIRYITGNLATYVNGRDVPGYLCAIKRIFQSPPDPRPLVDWAAEHTWAKNAEAYVGMFNDLLMEKSCK